MPGIHNDHSHICFKRKWKEEPRISYLLGQCEATIKAISNTPIPPETRNKLNQISLIKGAQATTAIEGNTLSFEEIEDIQNGKDLPPSREYLQKEVENILVGFNFIRKELIVENHKEMITPQLIREYHMMVGSDLGDAFEAKPGKFRRNNVIVGNYRAPNFEKVSNLVDNLCIWLKKEFHFTQGQDFSETITQAIVTHVYIAWIHPFSDGNGRTARLIEYYLLLRAGVPDIASHILSNHYNLTRSEYYRHIELATKQASLNDFLFYAIQGFRDGLNEILEELQDNQVRITWTNYIYEIFVNLLVEGKEEKAVKRKRNLILRIPPYGQYSIGEVFELHSSIFQDYKEVSNRTFARDLEELIKLKLLYKNKNMYGPNINSLRKYMAYTVN